MAGFAGTDQAGSYDEFLARCLGTGSPFGPVRRIERTRLMSAGAHELVAVVRRGASPLAECAPEDHRLGSKRR